MNGEHVASNTMSAEEFLRESWNRKAEGERQAGDPRELEKKRGDMAISAAERGSTVSGAEPEAESKTELVEAEYVGQTPPTPDIAGATTVKYEEVPGASEGEGETPVVYDAAKVKEIMGGRSAEETLRDLNGKLSEVNARLSDLIVSTADAEERSMEAAELIAEQSEIMKQIEAVEKYGKQVEAERAGSEVQNKAMQPAQAADPGLNDLDLWKWPEKKTEYVEVDYTGLDPRNTMVKFGGEVMSLEKYRAKERAAEAIAQMGDPEPLRRFHGLGTVEILRAEKSADDMPAEDLTVEDIKQKLEEKKEKVESVEDLKNEIIKNLPGNSAFSKIKKRVIAVVATLLAALSLVGCSKNGKISETEEQLANGASATELASEAALGNTESGEGFSLSKTVMENVDDVRFPVNRAYDKSKADVPIEPEVLDLRGEQVLPNGVHQNLDDYMSPDKYNEYNFGTSIADEVTKNPQAAIDMVVERMKNSPAILVDIAVAFPEVLKAVGLPEDISAGDLLDLLYNDEHGGEIQQQLLRILEAKFTKKNELGGYVVKVTVEHGDGKIYEMGCATLGLMRDSNGKVIEDSNGDGIWRQVYWTGSERRSDKDTNIVYDFSDFDKSGDYIGSKILKQSGDCVQLLGNEVQQEVPRGPKTTPENEPSAKVVKKVTNSVDPTDPVNPANPKPLTNKGQPVGEKAPEEDSVAEVVTTVSVAEATETEKPGGETEELEEKPADEERQTDPEPEPEPAQDAERVIPKDEEILVERATETGGDSNNVVTQTKVVEATEVSPGAVVVGQDSVVSEESVPLVEQTEGLVLTGEETTEMSKDNQKDKEEESVPDESASKVEQAANEKAQAAADAAAARVEQEQQQQREETGQSMSDADLDKYIEDLTRDLGDRDAGY